MPDKLPTKDDLLWEVKLSSDGNGGIAANQRFVIVASRNVLDTHDQLTCHDVKTGKEVWRYRSRCEGDLDYGNSSRATPLILSDRVIFQSAFGELVALDLESGIPLWKKHFVNDFGAELPTWGFCGSPLAFPLKSQVAILVQPGSETQSLVALDVLTGKTVWSSPGEEPSYSSFVLASINDSLQLVGYDHQSLGGWNLKGKRLWTYTPEITGDFNVPTPLIHKNNILISTENNGTRKLQLTENQNAKQVALFEQLTPDTHTPVRVGDLLCGSSDGLLCLKLDDLSLAHESTDPIFSNYTAMISDGKNRILVVGLEGEIALLEVTSERMRFLDRKTLTTQFDLMSHPAIAKGKLFIRIGRKLTAWQLATK